MADRLNRDPTYDLARHIITGELPPLSGDSAVQKIDNELDRNSSMEDFTSGAGRSLTYPRSADEVNAANVAQAFNLESANFLPKEAINMAEASDCHDEPTKGGLSYGPRNTGGHDGGY